MFFVKVLTKKTTPKSAAVEKTHERFASKTHPLISLQKTIGNQGMQSLIKSGALQAKLKISQPNDPYERQANLVAEQIVRMPYSEVSIKSQNSLDIRKKGNFIKVIFS